MPKKSWPELSVSEILTAAQPTTDNIDRTLLYSSVMQYAQYSEAVENWISWSFMGILSIYLSELSWAELSFQ